MRPEPQGEGYHGSCSGPRPWPLRRKTRRRGSLKEFAVLASGAENASPGLPAGNGHGRRLVGRRRTGQRQEYAGYLHAVSGRRPICAPITYPYRIGPWRVTSAQGEVSKRVEIRRARKLEEIQAQRRRERQKALEEQSHWGKVREVGAARVEEKIPQWKQRLRQRLNGETANHEGRRRKRKRD